MVVKGEDYRASAQILVDMSAAMKAPLFGGPAYETVLSTSLKVVESKGKLPTGVQFSWRSFGGGAPNEEASCDATQLLSPGGVTPGPPVKAAIKNLRAHGERPLASGLEATIADLPRDGNRQRAIVVVTSGGDTCGRDVCVAANDLRQTYGLGSVRVIFVGSDLTVAKKLGCLGKVTVAGDAAALERQLNDAVEAVIDPAQVTVSALEGNQSIQARVELYAASDKVASIKTETGAAFQTIGGVYQVRVLRGMRDEAPRSNDVKSEGLRQNVELQSGAQLAIKVPLGGQRARLTANVLLNGQPAPTGTRVAIFHTGDTDTPVIGGAPGEPISLPPGRYDVRAEIPASGMGFIEVWKPDVTVGSGADLKITLAAAQKLGRVKFTVTSAGVPVTGAVVALIHPNSRGDGEPLFDPSQEISFAPGTYKAVAQLATALGELRAMKSGVKVVSGELTEVTIELAATSSLQVNVVGRKAGDALNVVIYRSGEVESAGTLNAFEPQRLPSGTYDLRVDEMMFNPPRTRWYKRITLVPGETKLVNVTP
jgi:hypothetical protein